MLYEVITDQLVEILEYTKELFPKVERITMYGSAQYIALKTQEDVITSYSIHYTKLYEENLLMKDPTMRMCAKK